MAPNGKPGSYVMQQQRSPVQSLQEQGSKDANIQVKSECILFSHSIMSGRWNVSGNGHQHTEQPVAAQDGPEPRVLSKKRRDLINAEIRELQNLLPLKKSARERLSYLGILALTNTFIRKATFFKKESISYEQTTSSNLVPELSSSVYGFMLMFNREGKILYTSDNILDYLGNTVVELASQGDSIYDFVDKEDHDQIRAQLDVPPHDDRGEARKLSFFCRMSTSRYMKTQMRSWKNKIVHVTGRYYKPTASSDWSDTVFFAVCTPIESKPVADVRHHPSPRVAEFKAIHSADMNFVEVSDKVENLLGYKKEELENTSWYQLIYPEDIEQAKQQHMKFVKEDGSTLACVLRMIKKDGSLAWVDITAEKSQESLSSSFLCNYIIIGEEEVPYFRIHHNLLPFPEHYTDSQRQYLAYRSTLLSAALHNEIASATSTMTSQNGFSHVDSSHFPLAHPLYTPDMDAKTMLRRQLMKRKMNSSEMPICANPAAYFPDIYGVPPNKMLIRSASELPYPNAGAYHVPLQHSSSFSEGTLHPHVLYRGISGEDVYLSQFHNPNTAHGYLLDSGYTPIASSRKPSFTFHSSQRSPAVQSSESVSPVSGHSVQHNQNNNAQTVPAHHDEHYYSSDYSTPSASKPIYRDASFNNPVGSPYSQNIPSPTSPVLQTSPLSHPAALRQSRGQTVDGQYQNQNSVIDETYGQNATGSLCSSLPTSMPAMQQQCSTSSFGSSPCTVSYHSDKSVTEQPQLVVNSYRGVPDSQSYLGSCGWNQASYGNDPIHPTNLTTRHLKEEALSPPHCGVVNTQCSSPLQSAFHPDSPYHQGSVSPSRSSPGDFATSPCSQMVPDAYNVTGVEKPYHLQYSISSTHPASMQQYPGSAAAPYALDHGSIPAKGGFEWMKKYRNVPNMGMLISDGDCSNCLA